MSTGTPTRGVWSFLTKMRGRRARVSITRIQRRARDLMSLASIAGFFAVVWWLMIALFAWMASGVSWTDAAKAQSVLQDWHLMPSQPANAWLLVLSWLVAFVATMAPIVCLRRLGNALYSQPPLSLAVARRFHWLGHALIANIFFGFVAAGIASSQINDYQVSFSLGFWGTFVAATIAYMVAEMVREGALAAEENRAFV